MKSTAKRILNTVVLVLLCLAFGVFAAACSPETTPEPPKPPVKVSDGISFELGVGDSKNLTVADYITAYDNAVSATSSSTNATAAVAEGLLTVTGVAEGNATVTLACGDVSVAFDVTVYAKCTVTVDGKAEKVKKGSEYTLPATPTVADTDMTFDYWLVGEDHKAPGDKITVDSDVTITSVTKRKAPVKVKDGGAVTVTTTQKYNVAEYINTHGNAVTALSGNTAVATVAIEDGKIVITAVAEGDATVTVTCGAVEITFAVTVTAVAPTSYIVTVDGDEVATVNGGETYTLPAAPTVSDLDFEFVGWEIAGIEGVKQPGNTVTVESDLTVTAKIVRKAVEKIKNGITVNLKVDGETNAKTIAVSDYINTHGSAATVTAVSQDETKATAAISGDTLTVTAVAEGNTTVTLTCDTVTVTFTVNVTSVADGTPEFENGSISFDLFDAESGTYEFNITAPSDSAYTYQYTVTPDTGVSVSGNTLTYTATETVTDLELTVNVTATDTKYGTKTTSFSVTVNVTDTTPVANNSAATDTTVHDVYDGALTVDLTSNIDNPSAHVGTYKVNDVEVTDPTAYAVTGSYSDTITDVELTVVATFGTKTVTYTYSLRVIDTTVYRLANGNFDNDLDGWTLSNTNLGGVNSAETYWNENIPFNNDGKFFNAYYFDGEAKESAIGTLTSSAFKIGGSGYITYKLGAARNANVVYLDIVESSTGNILERYSNNAFSDDPTSTTVRGCTLVAYKANLSAHIGKTVYVRISDNAVSDYGLFFCDSFVTYYAEAPTSGVDAEAKGHPATIYDIYNGGFELDMAGWTVSGGDIGAITTDKGYWNDGDHESTANAYGQEGDKLFSWWSWEGNRKGEPDEGHEVNREGNMGTLTSNMFVAKAGNYVSFKFGGGNRNVFIELVNAESGSIIAVFRNDNIDGGKLKSYSYKVDELTENVLCYFRVVDNATAATADWDWDWGCFAADDFKANLDAAPEGSAAATNRVSEYGAVVNGNFESGLDGWTVILTSDDPNSTENPKSKLPLGAVTNTEKAEDWYQTNESVKDGDYLFTFYANGANMESGTGIIRSSAFILKKNGIVSFRFGAAHNSKVYINLYTTGGKLLATFRNNAWTQDTEMVRYYYQAGNDEEVSCYFEVVDNATDDYGCIVMDDFRVNLDAAPEGAVLGSAQTKAERFPPQE